jgi:hypothetical protein
MEFLGIEIKRENSQKRKERLAKRGPVRRWIGRTVKGALLLHLATQAVDLGHNLYTEINPSQRRKEFRQEFGFPIQGYSHDIEDNRGNFLNIVDTVAREKAERNFDLRSIGVQPENYLGLNLVGQVDAIIGTGRAAYYNSASDTIVLRNVTKATVHHEIKHAKTYEIIEKNPELLERWKALAVDDTGRSLYMSTPDQICSRIRGLEQLVDKEKYSAGEENKRLGFVSDYARTNVYEDIAELCEEAESENVQFRDLVIGEGRNEIVVKKAQLAIEYGLLPRGVIEMHGLRLQYSKVWESSGHFVMHAQKERAEKFLSKAEEFLRENPESIFEGEIRARMAPLRVAEYCETIYRSPSCKYRAELPDEGLKKVIEECKLSLKAKLKDRYYYPNALDEISSAYYAMKDTDKFRLYCEARKEYERRSALGDVRLTRVGVNDWLRERGELGEEGK